MQIINIIQNFTQSLAFPPLLIIGMMMGIGLYAGKAANLIKLPSIIGFMLIGLLLGPSFLNFLSEDLQQNLSFVTDIALGFVAVSIGLELSLQSLKKQGPGIILVIFTESFAAFSLVAGAVYLLTRDLPMALLFGAIAPASAPAGTVAIIKEYKASGSLTRALYAVVGFDDGLGIIIFGFAAAAARGLLSAEIGSEHIELVPMLLAPLKEIGFSLLIGAASAVVFSLLARKLKNPRDILIMIFSFVLLNSGLCHLAHSSIILTNMLMGTIIINTQPKDLTEKLHHELSEFMPLLFILFFILAGSSLHISALPALGLTGVVYILTRTAGLMGGAWIGATLGKLEDKIKKYLGMGILSQAGVAIGLSLIVKKELSSIGDHGALIGTSLITTVTATCIFFEIIGPILTRIGLKKAGEIRA